MKSANDKTFAEVVLQRSHQIPVLCDFWAPWCGPCRALAPILLQLERQFPATLEVVKVELEQARTAAANYKVESIPTLLLFRAGLPVGRIVGNAGSMSAIIQRLGLVA